jgi:hypothetical protein
MLFVAGTDEGREFAIRCYRWSLEQWRLEVESDLLMFRSMGDVVPIRVLTDLPRDRCLAIGLALANQSEGARLLGERASKEDETLQRWYAGQYLAESWAWVCQESRPKLSPQAKRKLWELVREAVEPVLGNKPERVEVAAWRYKTVVGRWNIFTTISIGAGPGWHLSYEHDLYRELPVARMLSILSCMSLFQMTQWRLESADDLSAAARGLAVACGRFLHAEPSVLW